MTQKTFERLESLRESTSKYAPQVQRQLASSGRKETALTQSVAKYYVALKELAQK